MNQQKSQRQLKREFNSYFQGIKKGVRDGWLDIKAQSDKSWKSLGFFRSRYIKSEFVDGYNNGHAIGVEKQTTEWDVLNPELYEEVYKLKYLYSKGVF